MKSREKVLLGSLALAVLFLTGSCLRKPVGEKQFSAVEPKAVEVTGSRIPREVDLNRQHPSTPWEMEILHQDRLSQTGQINAADALKQTTPFVQ